MQNKSYSLKFKMLVVLIPLLLIMVVVGIFFINYLISQALDKQLYANIKSLAKTAAGASRTGLQFEDNETIKDALKAFTEDEQLASLEVFNESGESVYHYRKAGRADVQSASYKEVTVVGDEIFVAQDVLADGQTLGRVVLSLSLQERNSALNYSKIFLIILSVIGLTILFLVVYLLANSISRPLISLAAIAESISAGELEQEINVSGTKEVDSLAKGFKSMLGYIREIAHLADKVSNGDLRSNVAVRSERDLLSLSFDRLMSKLRQIFGEISSYTKQLSESSGGLLSMSHEMSASSDDLNQTSGVIAQATEQMNMTIGTISTNVQEMSGTVSEIAQNAEKARSTTEKAVKSAEDTSARMKDLNEASLQINKVTEVIVDIAEQTKLLALNATIEAARAGEAGKGFAVVANEVKDLAQQTNKATEDIKVRLQKMQGSTSKAVESISQIDKIINEVSEMVSAIAAAVEEQTVNINDIADNISQTAQASESITMDMERFKKTSETAHENSSQLQVNALTLKKMNEKLQEIVNQFTI